MSKPSPEEFYQELKAGKFAPVYMLYGEDARAIDAALAAVEVRVLEGAEADFNAEYFQGKEAEPSRVAAAARTLPMMADRRLVVVRRVDEIKLGTREPLLAYLADPSPSTVLVLTAPGLIIRGARKEDEALIKAADKAGAAVEFARPKPAQLPHLIGELAQPYGKRLDSGAVEALIEFTGSETLGLAQEVAKICLYVGDQKTVTREDVLAAVADVREANIFDFTDALGSQQVEEALRALRRLREQGQEHLPILGMLVRHFRIIWQLQVYLDQGENSTVIARILKVNEWMLKKKYVPQAKKFPAADAGRIMKLLADLDLKLKSTRGDREVLFERAVINLCRGRFD